MMSKKIVIASLLKPVDDVRSYSKIAQSVAKTNKYEVNIIGNEGKKGSPSDNIHLYPHRIKRTNWLKRLLIRELILFKIIRLKPDVLIITTYELINVGLISKWLTRCKVIYDVQENYSKNVLLHRGVGFRIYSAFIKCIEWYGTFFIDYYWLAERCYKDEMSFPEGRWSVIENKAAEYPLISRQRSQLRLLFSGTVSRYSGAELAMKIMIECSKLAPGTQGIFIGQIHDPTLLKQLEHDSSEHPGIHLLLSLDPVSHSEVLDKIEWANVGIISYLPNEVNENKIPTKLYEYSRYRLPYLVQKNTFWEQVGLELGGAIPVDFEAIHTENLVDLLQKSPFQFPETYPEEATWEFESKELLNSIDKLIN